MKGNKTQKRNSMISSLFGEMTPVRASGWTYSFTAIAVLLFSFLFLLLLAVSGATKNEEYLEQDWYLYCSFLLSQVAFACVVWCVLRLTNTPLKEEIRAQKCKGKYFFIAVLLQIGLLSLSALNTLFLSFLEGFGYQDSPIILPSMDGFGFIGVLFVVAVLPAVFEEWIFRGLLLRGMRSFGTVKAVLISGFLFSIYHQNPAQTIYQFCCGAAFALVAIRSGSILPTVLSHFINNALIITLEKCGVSTFSTPVYIVILCISAVCLIGSLVWLIVFDKQKAEKKTIQGSQKEFWLSAAVGIVVYAFVWLSVLMSGM